MVAHRLPFLPPNAFSGDLGDTDVIGV